MTVTGALARAGLIVSAAFLASRILGYVRITITTAIFGASPELDAFFAAFRLPDLIYQLVAAGALGSAVVPVVASLRATGEVEHGFRVASTIANLMLISLGLLAAGFALFAPVLVPLLAPGFDDRTTQLAIELTRIMLVAPVILSVSAVSASLLNASGRFLSAAIAPIGYNLAFIVAAVLFGRTHGVTALAVGVVVGTALHLAVQVPSLYRAGYRHRPTIDIRDPVARRVFALMAPRALGLGAVQLTFLVNTTLASNIGVGAITAYTVAFTLLQLPIGIVANPLGVVALPTMAQVATTGTREELSAIVIRTVRLLAFALLFVAGLGIVLQTEIVRLLFAYGRFDESAVAVAAGALGVFLLGLPAHGMIGMLARAFYARQETRTPVVGAILAVAINIVVAVLTAPALGIQGLALGIALGAWAEASFLIIRLSTDLPGLDPLRELRAVLRFGFLAAGGAAVAWAVLAGLEAVMGGPLLSKPLLILVGGAVAIVSAAAWFTTAIVIGLPEPATIRRLLVGALRRRQQPA
ncbi:MAG: murein biosynthesis integral membrane protein MurJ [Chloroflexi bacterium]|nr:murein biosynthesis integral membrane protein MurJ [Chloroflexota bacterium]